MLQCAAQGDEGARRKVVALALAVALFRKRDVKNNDAKLVRQENKKSSTAEAHASLMHASTRAVAASNTSLWCLRVLLHVQTGSRLRSAETFELRLNSLRKSDRGSFARLVEALCGLSFEDASSGQRVLGLARAVAAVDASLLASMALHVSTCRLRAWSAAASERSADFRVLSNAYYCLRTAEAAVAVMDEAARGRLAPLLLELQLVCTADDRLKLPLVYAMHISHAAEMKQGTS